MALHVQTNLQSTPVTPQSNPLMFEGNQLTVEAMQKLVGGYVQVRTLKDHINIEGKTYVAMGMNEDGKMHHLPRNNLASEIGYKYGAIGKGDFIVGDAILFEAIEMEDEE